MLYINFKLGIQLNTVLMLVHKWLAKYLNLTACSRDLQRYLKPCNLTLFLSMLPVSTTLHRSPDSTSWKLRVDSSAQCLNKHFALPNQNSHNLRKTPIKPSLGPWCEIPPWGLPQTSYSANHQKRLRLKFHRCHRCPPFRQCHPHRRHKH